MDVFLAWYTAKSHVTCKLQLYSAMLSCKVPPRPMPEDAERVLTHMQERGMEPGAEAFTVR